MEVYPLVMAHIANAASWLGVSTEDALWDFCCARACGAKGLGEEWLYLAFFVEQGGLSRLPANRFLRLASLQSCISSAPDRNGFHARLRLDGFCAEMGIRKDVLVEKSFSVLRRSGWQLRFHVSKVEVLCRAQACWCCYSVLLVRKFGDCPTYPKFCHLCRLLMVWEIVDLSIVM